MSTSEISSSASAKAPELADSENGIIDPNGLSVFRLTMMVITASVCGGIFSLAGDLAAGGAIPQLSWFPGLFALLEFFLLL